MGGLGSHYQSPYQNDDADQSQTVYGIWISRGKGYWLFNEATGAIFHTPHLGVAFAQKKFVRKIVPHWLTPKEEEVAVCTIGSDGLPKEMIKFKEAHDEK